MMCTMIVAPRNHAAGQTYNRPRRKSSGRDLLRQFTSSSSSSTSSLSNSSPSTSSPSKLQYHNRYSASINRFLRAINAQPIKGELDCFEADKEGFAAAFSRLEQSDPATRALAHDEDLRYDIVQDKFLIIRMLEKVDHSFLADAVSTMICEHLHGLRDKFHNGSDTYALLDSILRLGTGAMPTSGGRIQPDQQFFVSGDHNPGVVIEVATSQRFSGLKGLHRRLYNLVVESQATVKVAIGLEMNKGKPRLSLWASKIVPVDDHPHGLLDVDILLNREFLEKGGNLELYVKDFVSSAEFLATRFPHLDRRAKITIPFAEIVNVVDLAIRIREEFEEFDRSKLPNYLMRPYSHSWGNDMSASYKARRTNSVVKNQKRPFSSLSPLALGLNFPGINRLPRSSVASVNTSATLIAMYQPPRSPFGVSTTSSGIPRPRQWSTSIGRSLAYIRRVLR